MGTNNFRIENVCIVIPEKFSESWFDLSLYIREQILPELVSELGMEGFLGYSNDDYVIADKIVKKAHSGIEFARVMVIISNGYYHGVSLDYIVEYLEEDEYYIEEGAKQKQSSKTAEKSLQVFLKRLDKKLGKFGTRIIKVGQFDNGEAIYQKA